MLVNIYVYLAVLVFSTSLCSGSMLGGSICPIDFKEWLTCPDYEDKANVNITNTFIDHAIGAVRVSCDMNVLEDFGHNEFSMVVDMSGSNDNQKFMHDRNVHEDGICKSLKEGNFIITTAFELMGFPKGQKCPIKKGLYEMRNKTITLPPGVDRVFKKYRFWRIDIKFITGDSACEKQDKQSEEICNYDSKPVEMCLRTLLINKNKDAESHGRQRNIPKFG